MKRLLVCLALTVSAWPAPAATDDPPFTTEFVYKVCRNLYRWEMDESTVLRASLDADIVALWRNLEVKLDKGDASRYRELYLPQFQMAVTLKKADYPIPETGQQVRNRDYTIQKVDRGEGPPVPTNAYERIVVNRKEMTAYLFKTRSQRAYPDAALQERLRAALRSAQSDADPAPAVGPQTVFVAPISPVSNNLWVFWENRGWLVKFSSDSDIDNPAYWEAEKVGVRVYDLAEHVVVSLDEVQGSHAYITRDWAARAVFNCVVFGQRLDLEAAAGSAGAARQ